MVDEDPKVLELDLIYAIDNNGSGFSKVFYEPSLGRYDDKSNVYVTDSHEDDNAICIN
jgi:hypothetical protein